MTDSIYDFYNQLAHNKKWRAEMERMAPRMPAYVRPLLDEIFLYLKLMEDTGERYIDEADSATTMTHVRFIVERETWTAILNSKMNQLEKLLKEHNG